MRINQAYPKDWKEIRRFRAFELWQEGWQQQEIAEALGVSKMAVSQWIAKVKKFGHAGLCARPHTGAPAKLTEEQMNLIPDLLSHGAEAYGFRGEVWTCARVREVIRREFGVTYHRAHVSRLLKELEWTPQKPIERAKQRNEEEIERWRKKVWPELKKKLD